MHCRDHVIDDKSSREEKAKKIEYLLSRYTLLDRKRVLDFGAGSGWISDYFVRRGCNVVAADRNRNLSSEVDVEFVCLDEDRLPLKDNEFDIVISNHVIEHVGNQEAQLKYLVEAHRVLKKGGLIYLSVPNKWTLIEPHYRLPFLSWLGERLASRYVRSAGKHTWYDCKPLDISQLVDLFEEAGFLAENITSTALDYFVDIENSKHWSVRVGQLMPTLVRKLLLPFIPTLVVIGNKGVHDAS